MKKNVNQQSVEAVYIGTLYLTWNSLTLLQGNLIEEKRVAESYSKSDRKNSAWYQSCNRNQWVWVPCPDSSRIYERDSSGKIKSKLYKYSATGSSEYTNVNNIYDMAGNVWDWMLCGSSNYARNLRGGCYFISGESDPVGGFRIDNCDPMYSGVGSGVRAYCYIQ